MSERKKKKKKLFHSVLPIDLKRVVKALQSMSTLKTPIGSLKMFQLVFRANESIVIQYFTITNFYISVVLKNACHKYLSF